MQLWTEYEGHTIDGAFVLDKLLLSEGRSAFFSTLNGNSKPALIRLIASHFDEEEILARWRGVDALGHPNILKIERYGQVVLDDTTMVYAIFEPVDVSLADVLVAQRLNVVEAKELALSLASALELLHKNGFVHEHVEPAKIFAVGEVVKLRGDCIRETPEGEIGQEAKRKDVHDLAVVLLLALTQTERLEEAKDALSLPSPLDKIVRNAWNGSWGLSQIVAALNAGSSPVAPALRAINTLEEPKIGSAAPAEPVAKPTFRQDPPEPSASRGKFVPPGQRQSIPEKHQGRGGPLPLKWLALAGLVILIAFLLIWRGLHHRSAAQNISKENSVSSSLTTSSASGQPATTDMRKAKSSAATSAAAIKSSLPPQKNTAASNTRLDSRDQWRVVAFTYNHQDQAQKKVDTISQKHADLHPAIFTPTGHAPYLITVGGVMSRDQAFAYVQQVRKLGLPHDTYAQNYSNKRP